MIFSKIAIPPEFGEELESTIISDTRNDFEILSSLNAFRPVTNEKNIWAFWHYGLDMMPDWCKRNVTGWVRICGPTWTIRVTDNDPASPNYVFNYVPVNAFPDCFVNRTMDGAHSGQYSADVVRTATLLHHGGAYIDVGSIMIRHIDRICWDTLADPTNPFNVCVPVLHGTFIADSFVAARKGDPFIEACDIALSRYTLFTHLWKDRTNSAGLLDHPLMTAIDLKLDGAGPTSEVGMKVNFKVPLRVAYEYVTQVPCWQRLSQLDHKGPASEDAANTFSPADYWRNNVLVLPNIRELHPLEAVAGFQGGGKVIFDHLRMPAEKQEALPAGFDESAWCIAKDVVWKTLARGSLEKVMRGKNMTVEATLGYLWDEAPGTDCGQGTFAEVLRLGALPTRQKRPAPEMLGPAVPDRVLNKGVLEV